MSTSIEGDGTEIEIGQKCPVNGRTTVSVEFVVGEDEHEQMIQRLVDGSAIDDREGVIEALNLVEPEVA